MSKHEIYKDNIDNTLFPPYGLTTEGNFVSPKNWEA